MLNRTSRSWIASLLLGMVCLGLYYPATGNEFVSDSFLYFYYNELWISSLRPEHIIWMFTSTEIWNWHPLTWLSWAIDYQLYGGLDTAGFHFSNNVLHAVNTILLFLLVCRILIILHDGNSPSATRETYIVLAALIASLVFAVHPQKVEAVAWVASRQHLLCQAFLMLATLAYLKPFPGRTEGAAPNLRTALFWFVLAGLSKPTAIVFPVILLILDYYPLRRLSFQGPAPLKNATVQVTGLVVEKKYFFVISALLAAVTLFIRTDAIKDIPLPDRILNAFNSIVFYLEKLLWPVDFSTYYAYFVPLGGPYGVKVWLAVVLFFLVTVSVTWKALKHDHRGGLAAWLFFLVTLAPVIGLIPTGPQGGADRYAYLATIPAYIAAGVGVYWLLQRQNRAAAATVLALLAAILVFLSQQTLRQIKAWENEFTLWSNAYSHYPQDAYVNHQLGAALLDRRRPEQAAKHFQTAFRADPSMVQSAAWAGLTLARIGKHQEALDWTLLVGEHAATGAHPRVDELCLVYNVGWNLAHLERWQESLHQFSVMPSHGPYADVTKAWLEWLEAHIAADHALVDIQGELGSLPGLCFAPLYEMRRRPLRPDFSPP